MPGVRERARVETVAEIKRLAREQIATAGAPALSLRQIARDMGLVSSALYRYFPSRDELLTALILDAYNSLGDAVERADAAAAGRSIGQRHLAVCRSVRSWAVAQPSEWALIYGSPVPGYKAPQDTIGPATRVAVVFMGLLADAAEQGLVRADDPLVVPRGLRQEARRLGDQMGRRIPDAMLVRGLVSWIHIIGAVSVELFGQLVNVIEDRAAFFDHQVARMADLVGFAPA